jgi:hypothetical protein
LPLALAERAPLGNFLPHRTQRLWKGLRRGFSFMERRPALVAKSSTRRAPLGNFLPHRTQRLWKGLRRGFSFMERRPALVAKSSTRSAGAGGQGIAVMSTHIPHLTAVPSTVVCSQCSTGRHGFAKAKTGVHVQPRSWSAGPCAGGGVQPSDSAGRCRIAGASQQRVLLVRGGGRGGRAKGGQAPPMLC